MGTVKTQCVSFLQSPPLQAMRNPMGQARGGGSSQEKGLLTSPTPLRPEPELVSKGRPWREVVVNIDWKARPFYTPCDLSQAPLLFYASVSSSV